VPLVCAIDLFGIDKSNIRLGYISLQFTQNIEGYYQEIVVLDVTVYPLKLFYSKGDVIQLQNLLLKA
jgi:hypothetical protein